MKKTVCELFAGVGGFRCGLNNIRTVNDASKTEKWETVWFSQWEPAEKTTQYAHDCYAYRFGTCLDLKGEDTTRNNETFMALTGEWALKVDITLGGEATAVTNITKTVAE